MLSYDYSGSITAAEGITPNGDVQQLSVNARKRFTITPDGQFGVTRSLNYEQYVEYRISYTASTSRGDRQRGVITLTVGDRNDAPTLSAISTTIRDYKKGGIVFTVTGFDEDGDNLSYEYEGRLAGDPTEVLKWFEGEFDSTFAIDNQGLVTLQEWIEPGRDGHLAIPLRIRVSDGTEFSEWREMTLTLKHSEPYYLHVLQREIAVWTDRGWTAAPALLQRFIANFDKPFDATSLLTPALVNELSDEVADRIYTSLGQLYGLQSPNIGHAELWAVLGTHGGLDGEFDPGTINTHPGIPLLTEAFYAFGGVRQRLILADSFTVARSVANGLEASGISYHAGLVEGVVHVFDEYTFPQVGSRMDFRAYRAAAHLEEEYEYKKFKVTGEYLFSRVI